MPPTPESVLVKGTPVQGLCHFIASEITAERCVPVFRQLPEPWAARFASGQILASDRIPLSVVNLLTTLAAEAKGEAVEAFGERAGLYGAKEGIHSVFKPFFYVLSVANALSVAPLMWSRIYSAGKMQVDSDRYRASIHVREFPGSVPGCGRATGWFRYIGTLSGAKNLRSRHELCTGKGGAECLWKFEWE